MTDPNKQFDALSSLGSSSSSTPSSTNLGSSSVNTSAQQNNSAPQQPPPQKKGSTPWVIIFFTVGILAGCVAAYLKLNTATKSQAPVVESPFDKAMAKVKTEFPNLKVSPNLGQLKARFEAGAFASPCDDSSPKDLLTSLFAKQSNDPTTLLMNAAKYQEKVLPAARAAANEWNSSLPAETAGLLKINVSPRTNNNWDLCVSNEDVKFLLSVKTVLKNTNKFPAYFYNDYENAEHFKAIQAATAITSTKNQKDDLAYLLRLKYQPIEVPISKQLVKLLASLK
jgi:hypothetical protein